MALVTETFSTAFNGAALFQAIYDDVSLIVQTVSVTNNLAVDVWVSVSGHAQTFPPGTTTQDVSAFNMTVTRAGAFNFPVSTRAPA